MPEEQGRIVALGGGGVSQDPDNPRLLDYLLATVGHDRPRVCFLGTATGDRDANVVQFYQAFGRRGYRAGHQSLFPRQVEDLRGLLLAQDLIYVGGGNTANLLAVWRVHGLDAILRDAWAAGVVLAGVSAGAICWFEAGITDSFGPTLAPLNDGLGFLPGSCCPHYDGEAQRRPTYRRCVGEGLPEGLAIDDGCAVHFRGRTVVEVVTSLPTARAYRVRRGDDGAVTETPLDARYLD